MRGIFASHGLLSAEEAERKFRELEVEVEASIEKQETKEYTVEAFISTNYDIISAIYAGLLRNSLHAKTFDISSYIELFSEPSKLMEFVHSFGFHGENIQTVCPVREFIVRAQQNWIDVSLFDSEGDYRGAEIFETKKQAQEYLKM
jgi:hypothetical protein